MNKICSKSWYLLVLTLIVLLALCTGCMSRLSSVASQVLRPPALLSLQQLEYQGKQGAWMDNQDALALAVWADFMDGIFRKSETRRESNNALEDKY